jgi:hypothetical protein
VRYRCHVVKGRAQALSLNSSELIRRQIDAKKFFLVRVDQIAKRLQIYLPNVLA